MICHNCKKKIQKESRYCKYCGAPQFYDANYRDWNDARTGDSHGTNPSDHMAVRTPYDRNVEPAAFETPLPPVRRPAANPAALIAAIAAVILLAGICVWTFSLKNSQKNTLQAQMEGDGAGGPGTDGSGQGGDGGNAPASGIIEGAESSVDEEAENSPGESGNSPAESGNSPERGTAASPAENSNTPEEEPADAPKESEATPPEETTANNTAEENAATPEETQSRVTLNDTVPEPKNSADTPAASAPDYTAWNGVWEVYAPEGYLEAQLTFDCGAGSDVANCNLFFYRLMNADVTVSFADGSSVGVIQDNIEKLSGTVELGEDEISLHLNDDEPVYFDDTPSQFFGRTDFTYTRQ